MELLLHRENNGVEKEKYYRLFFIINSMICLYLNVVKLLIEKLQTF
jgi:hypothetical protein